MLPSPELTEPEKLAIETLLLTLRENYCKFNLTMHQGRIADVSRTVRVAKSETEETLQIIHVPLSEIEQAYEIEAMKECVSV